MKICARYIVCVVVILMAGCDDSLSFDSHGVAHGTGEKVYSYASGSIKLREEYRNGQGVRSRWFKPDGTLIQETLWANGTGEGLYLREDGSIRTRMEYVNGLAEGKATQYDERGNITKIEIYRGGQRVLGNESPATQPGR